MAVNIRFILSIGCHTECGMNCERSDKRGYMQYICVVSVVVGAIVIEVSVLLRAYNNAKGGIMRLSRD